MEFKGVDYNFSEALQNYYAVRDYSYQPDLSSEVPSHVEQPNSNQNLSDTAALTSHLYEQVITSDFLNINQPLQDFDNFGNLSPYETFIEDSNLSEEPQVPSSLHIEQTVLKGTPKKTKLTSEERNAQRLKSQAEASRRYRERKAQARAQLMGLEEKRPRTETSKKYRARKVNEQVELDGKVAGSEENGPLKRNIIEKRFRARKAEKESKLEADVVELAKQNKTLLLELESQQKMNAYYKSQLTFWIKAVKLPNCPNASTSNSIQNLLETTTSTSNFDEEVIQTGFLNDLQLAQNLENGGTFSSFEEVLAESELQANPSSNTRSMNLKRSSTQAELDAEEKHPNLPLSDAEKAKLRRARKALKMATIEAEVAELAKQNKIFREELESQKMINAFYQDELTLWVNAVTLPNPSSNDPSNCNQNLAETAALTSNLSEQVLSVNILDNMQQTQNFENHATLSTPFEDDTIDENLLASRSSQKSQVGSRGRPKKGKENSPQENEQKLKIQAETVKRYRERKETKQVELEFEVAKLEKENKAFQEEFKKEQRLNEFYKEVLTLCIEPNNS